MSEPTKEQIEEAAKRMFMTWKFGPIESLWDDSVWRFTGHRPHYETAARFHLNQLAKITSERDEARAACAVKDEALKAPILGCAPMYYLNEQFPETIGHIPLREFFNRQTDALNPTPKDAQ